MYKYKLYYKRVKVSNNIAHFFSFKFIKVILNIYCSSYILINYLDLLTLFASKIFKRRQIFKLIHDDRYIICMTHYRKSDSMIMSRNQLGI